MATFSAAIPTVLKHEGGFVNHKSDPGGATNFGISLRFLRSEGHDVDGDGDVDIDDVYALTPTIAEDIYEQYFWKRVYSEIEDQAVATKVFDTAVNTGHKRSHKILQSALVNLGEPIMIDGIFGARTLRATNRTNPDHLLSVFRAKQFAFYMRLIRKNQALYAFKKGWERRAYS